MFQLTCSVAEGILATSMATDISKIFAPIAGKLQEFERLLDQVLTTDSPFIRDITAHLFSRTGKRLRPGLLLLTSGQASRPEAISAGVAIELIHVATLLHDDVIDQSTTRRGIETVNHRWGNLVSVLMGDYLFAKAFGLLVSSGSAELLRSFSAATERVAIGELNQVYNTANLELAEEEYMKIISDKTASLMACAAEAGIVCSGGDTYHSQALKEFGENLGVAFQITDDLLDLVGESVKTGKQLGADVRQGWITLPLIYALRNGGKHNRERLRKLYTSPAAEDDFVWVIDFVRDSGGLEYADRVAKRYSDRAKEILHKVSDLDFKDNLLELADFAVQRNA